MNNKANKAPKESAQVDTNTDVKVDVITENKAEDKPDKALADTNSKALLVPVEVDSPYKSVLIGMAPKLSAKSTGLIGYEIAVNEENKCRYLRLTSNDSGGLFSKEWVNLEDIYTILESLAGKKPFKSSTFKPIIKGGSANNVSFLSAVLRCDAVALIVQSHKNQFLHVVHTKWADHRKNISVLKQLPALTEK
jgi:hypothetical protein